VLESSFGDTLGGLALSLAGWRELSVVRWRSIECFARVRDAVGLCRSETDSCAGGRRGWRLVEVPGGSVMVAAVVPGRSDYEKTAYHIRPRSYSGLLCIRVCEPTFDDPVARCMWRRVR
jgi:hypothetical protein